MRRAAASLLAASCAMTLLAACSGSSSGRGTASTGAGSSTPAPATSSAASSSAASSSAPAAASSSPAPPAGSSAAPGATAAALRRIVLRPGDLPAGWKSSGSATSGSSGGAQTAAVLRCAGGRDTKADRIASIDSPDFSSGTATISSSADGYRTQSAVDADVATLHSPKLDACFQKPLRSAVAGSLPAGYKVTSLSFRITPGSGGGPHNVVATGNGTIKISVNARGSATVHVEMAFVTGPRVEAQVSAESIGAPVPSALFAPLVAKVAARAARG